MPSLPPSQTIQIPVAPTMAQAQPPRSSRIDDAIEQKSTSFGSALSSAGDALDTTPNEISVDPDDSQTETDSAESEAAQSDPKQESTVDPDSEVTTDVDPVVAALPVPNQSDPNQASPAPIGEQGQKSSEQPIRQSLDQTSQSIPLENGELSSPLDEAETPLPEKSTQTAIIQQTTAPAPQQNVEPSSSSNETPIEGQAIALDVSANAGTTSGDGQNQPDHASTGTPESAPIPTSSDPPAAQPLRQVSVEPAPSAIDSQTSIQATDLQGARTASPQQPSQAPSLGVVEPDQAFNSAVGRGLAAAVRQQGGTLTIKLDPPTLGKLTIRMTIEHGKVEATFEAQTAQARDLLMEHVSTLRAQLRDRGLTVERIEIIGATSAGKAGQSPSNTGDQPGADGEQGDSRHDAAGGHSRGRSETGEEQSSMSDGATGDTAGTAGEPMTSPFEAQLRYSVSTVA